MKNEQIYKAQNGIEVRYKHKKSKYDFKHLIIVFSGFLNKDPGNYDFINALNDCPADVLWIGDNFNGSYAYYLCADMDFGIEVAVTEFIHHKIQELGLSLDNVTATGFSKGGSSALYYGLKLKLNNIVVSVPQINIGSYLKNYWSHVADKVMGEKYTSIEVSTLDKLIVQLLKTETKFDRNIYLLTSEADMQYKTEIEPYLNDFARYRNFNLLKTYSNFVREHNQVTSHHTALLLSIYYALASEAVPRYSEGSVNFFGKLPTPTRQKSGEPYVDLRIAELKNDRLFIEGVGILRGYSLAEYSDIDYQLILIDTVKNTRIEKNLAKAHRPALTRELFDGESLVVYDKGWFATYQFAGVEIDSIPIGKYQLWLKIKVGTLEKTIPVATRKSGLSIKDEHTALYLENEHVILENKK